MAKVKRFLTKQEDRLLCAIRAVYKGKLTDEAIEASIAAVKKQKPIDVVYYELSEGQTPEEFMEQYFGPLSYDDQFDEEPSEMYMIDFK